MTGVPDMERPQLDGLSGALADHAGRYPKMGPADAVKLVFQNEFGGGHLIADPQKNLDLLRAEYAAVPRGTPSRPLLVAIDGRCAAGKTTLAARLHRDYGWSVVHMDHFFLRPEQRTRERLDTPGGNVDYERFLAQVLRPLRDGLTPEYRPFDCRTQRLAPPIRVEESPVVLVEGSYSCHPQLWDYYDLHVFLTVPAREQSDRILTRNGPQSAQTFREVWIPLEERYFSAYKIEERCAYRLTL